MRKKIQEIVIKKSERKYVDEKRAKYFEKLFQKTREQFGEKSQEKEDSEKQPEKESRSKFYNSKNWKKSRSFYYQDHQNCELCALRNIENTAVQIHHVVKWYPQANDSIRWKLLCDTENLISLCKEHHEQIHAGKANDLFDENQKALLEQKKQYIQTKYLSQNIIIRIPADKNYRKL